MSLNIHGIYKLSEMEKKKTDEEVLNSAFNMLFGPQKRSESSGLVPKGDARLTINISKEHHKRLKVAAAEQSTTIGELIERLIDKGLDG